MTIAENGSTFNPSAKLWHGPRYGWATQPCVT